MMATTKELAAFWNLLNNVYEIQGQVYYPTCIHKRKGLLQTQYLVNIKLIFSGIIEQRKPRIIHALIITDEKEEKEVRDFQF